MDQSKENSRSRRNAISLLQGDEIFFNKLISRDSSMGISSSFYFRTPDGVPFKWESQPGTPIHPYATTADLLPPLSPPPAALAPRSFGGVPNGSTSLIPKAIWFWKKKKKKKSSNYKRNQQRMECGIEADRVGPWEIWSSDDANSVTTPRDLWCSSSASSSSSVGSFNGCDSPRWRRGKGETGSGLGPEVGQSCGPWSFGRVLACVARG